MTILSIRMVEKDKQETAGAGHHGRESSDGAPQDRCRARRTSGLRQGGCGRGRRGRAGPGGTMSLKAWPGPRRMSGWLRGGAKRRPCLKEKAPERGPRLAPGGHGPPGRSGPSRTRSSRGGARGEQKRALASLLLFEREKTDQHLLIERARSDESLSARDDFLGMVSHDLRTLLGGIALHAAILIRNAAGTGMRSGRGPPQGCGDHPTLHRANEPAGGRPGGRGQHRGGQDTVAPARHDADRLWRIPSRPSSPPRGPRPRVASDVGPGTPCWPGSTMSASSRCSPTSSPMPSSSPAGRTDLAPRRAPGDSDPLFSVADTGPGLAEPPTRGGFEGFWQVRGGTGGGWAWGSTSPGALWRPTGAASGRRAAWDGAASSSSRCHCDGQRAPSGQQHWRSPNQHIPCLAECGAVRGPFERPTRSGGQGAGQKCRGRFKLLPPLANLERHRGDHVDAVVAFFGMACVRFAGRWTARAQLLGDRRRWLSARRRRTGGARHADRARRTEMRRRRSIGRHPAS